MHIDFCSKQQLRYSMLKVEIRRGGLIESTHRVHARVETADGNVLFNTTDDFDFFARSAIKPFQSYLLLKSGAFESLNLDLTHLALASASHAGELQHTDRVTAWLEKLGLDYTALRCGTHWPGDAETGYFMHENKLKPCAIHNNCSGKHTGFLSVCAHLKLPFEGYHLIDHPLQQKLKTVLENEFDCQLMNYGIDGCSIPAFMVSFHKMSKAFARMAAQALTDPSSTAGLVVQAFKTNPVLTSGTADYCTRIMVKNARRILVKGGAEGVVAGVFPEKKLSILVKCHDGSHRGSEHAFDYLVQKWAGLQPAMPTKLNNWVGTEVGHVEVIENV